MTWDTCERGREMEPEHSGVVLARATRRRGGVLCFARTYLALLLAGLLGWPQALDVEAAAVLLVAPEPLVQLGRPLALGLLDTPVGRAPGVTVWASGSLEGW